MLGALARRRFATVQPLLDALSWVVGLLVAVAVVVVGGGDEALSGRFLGILILVGVAGQAVGGFGVRAYRGRYRYGSYEEVLGVLRIWAAVAAMLLTVDALQPPLALQVPLAGAALALLLMLGSRWTHRFMLERARFRSVDEAERVLVYGAGEGGAQIVASMLADDPVRYIPVALLDDDPRKRHLEIKGVKVVGPRASLAKAARAHDAGLLLIAVPSADAALIRDVTKLAAEAHLRVRVLPSVSDIVGGTVGVGQIRTIDPADLLGRRPRVTGLGIGGSFVRGKRVLVTGAGGSIGSALSREIRRHEPAELLVLDRDEGGLHALQLALEGRALLDRPDILLADIRDGRGLLDLFERHQPDIVFHAAALKHLPLLERHPGEAVKTNVHGTLAVLEAAVATGVQQFVNISTDKAADPTSVLGYSKRITERLTTAVAEETGRRYLSVRFGNVLNTRGSVLQTFRSQLEAGGPLTVTHPDVTRYFMTVEEAVQLVLQAGGIGSSGEVLILDMGEPVRIGDVARRLAAVHPEPVEIVYTGLRPGEKLEEVLWSVGEEDVRPIHPLIAHTLGQPLTPDAAWSLDPFTDHGELVRRLRQLSRAPDRRRSRERRLAHRLHRAHGDAERRRSERRQWHTAGDPELFDVLSKSHPEG